MSDNRFVPDPNAIPKYATFEKFVAMLPPSEKVSVHKLYSLAKQGKLPVCRVADTKSVCVNIEEARAVLASLTAQGKIRRGYVAEGSANSAGALEGALSASLGVSRRTLAGDELWITGLLAWGALVANALRRNGPVPSPNATPWDHIPPAEREELANALRLGGSSLGA
jgi:hypothetical protein